MGIFELFSMLMDALLDMPASTLLELESKGQIDARFDRFLEFGNSYGERVPPHTPEFDPAFEQWRASEEGQLRLREHQLVNEFVEKMVSFRQAQRRGLDKGFFRQSPASIFAVAESIVFNVQYELHSTPIGEDAALVDRVRQLIKGWGHLVGPDFREEMLVRLQVMRRQFVRACVRAANTEVGLHDTEALRQRRDLMQEAEQLLASTS